MPIYIPTDCNSEDLDRLRRGEISRGLLRRLDASAVNVYKSEWQALWNAGKLEKTMSGFTILADTSAYDEACGLNVYDEPGTIFWQ